MKMLKAFREYIYICLSNKQDKNPKEDSNKSL